MLNQGKTNWKYTLIVLVLTAIVGGGILWLAVQWGVSSLVVGQEVTVKGKVTNLNAEPLTRDGDGILLLLTNDGNRITVRFPAYEKPCGTTGVIETFSRTRIADEVEIFGKVTGKKEITLCGSSSYYIKIVDRKRSY